MRIRTVKPGFWTNEELASCSEHARLLAIAILNYADDHGYFKADVRLVRAACCPFDDDTSKVRRSIDELSSIGYVSIVEASSGKQIGRVVRFSEHQRVDRAKPSLLQSEYKECGRKPAENPVKTGAGSIDDESTNDRRTVDDESTLEREQGIGKGTGNREGEGEGNAPPPAPDDPPFWHLATDEDLDTAKFRAAWTRWVGWVDSQNDRPMDDFRADRDLRKCSEFGHDLAVECIGFTIERDYWRRLLDARDDWDKRRGGNPQKRHMTAAELTGRAGK